MTTDVLEPLNSASAARPELLTVKSAAPIAALRTAPKTAGRKYFPTGGGRQGFCGRAQGCFGTMIHGTKNSFRMAWT